jgi:O-antigen ligase
LVPVLRWSAGIGRQLLGLLFAVFSVLIVWYAQSRGAMLGLAMQLLTAGFLRAKGKWLSRMVLIGILGVGYGLTLTKIGRDAAEMQESSDSRIMYWKAAISMTLHHPVFGVGFGHYPDTYNQYSSGERYEYGRRTAHSSWFLVFAESGLVGGSLFLAFFLLILKTAWRNRQRWPEQLYALVGYGVVMSFLSHTYTFYFYLLAGVIMASDSLKGDLDHAT